MSHRSGITIPAAVESVFAKARSGKYRVLQLVLNGEQIEVGNCAEPEKTWKKDFDVLLAPLTNERSCFYCFYRLDTKNSLGYEFILFSYINDKSAVRDKMMYASTLSTVKMGFGGGHLSRDLVVTLPEELTFAGYSEQMKMDEVDGPLTENEIMKQEIKLMESTSITAKHETVPGLSFPVAESATTALRDFAAGKVNYVQLSIDTEAEQILANVSEMTNGSAERLQSHISPAGANYHLYRLSYKLKGKQMKKDCFIYSMPTEAQVPIKEKMLYASCKASFVTALSNFNIKTDDLLSIEIDGPSEVSEEALCTAIHPDTVEVKKAFSKPAGPGARRPRTKRN